MKLTLTAARINAGFRKSEVAKAIGKTERTITNYEKGISSPSAVDLFKLAELYGCDTNDFSLEFNYTKSGEESVGI